ncbi:putative hexokinase [Naviculisporaceae sp. PSN 640]
MGSDKMSIDEFLKPLAVDPHLLLDLSREMTSTFERLCRDSGDQFLPTPISESIMRAGVDRTGGRGGTNLRVGFVELVGARTSESLTAHCIPGDDARDEAASRRVNRLLEQSWPIQEHLKSQNSDMLFDWIGSRIAEVVHNAREASVLDSEAGIIPMGITFSFPMEQSSLSEATLMFMGKGFAITSDLNLGLQLLKGYERNRTPDLPNIQVAAISNDAVSTLVSFIHQYPAQPHQKAAMGLIVGTGCNATIPLKLGTLGAKKRRGSVSVTPDHGTSDLRIAVNTEWSINGSAPPLRKYGLITRWDEELDRAGEVPGFQPLEYMTAGRYLGELARLMFLDYVAGEQGHLLDKLPDRLRQRFGLTTTFISHFYPDSPKGDMVSQLKKEFPLLTKDDDGDLVEWTPKLAEALYQIAHAIEVRAAGIVAASTIALLKCAGDIAPVSEAVANNGVAVTELAVGYTGGCIQHFHNYLADTQRFIDEILDLDFREAGKQETPIRVVLSPCHDGGITGAGILVPAALGSRVVQCE